MWKKDPHFGLVKPKNIFESKIGLCVQNHLLKVCIKIKIRQLGVFPSKLAARNHNQRPSNAPAVRGPSLQIAGNTTKTSQKTRNPPSLKLQPNLPKEIYPQQYLRR